MLPYQYCTTEHAVQRLSKWASGFFEQAFQVSEDHPHLHTQGHASSDNEARSQHVRRQPACWKVTPCPDDRDCLGRSTSIFESHVFLTWICIRDSPKPKRSSHYTSHCKYASWCFEAIFHDRPDPSRRFFKTSCLPSRTTSLLSYGIIQFRITCGSN